ncbi:hypothetical protein OE88DRAFT_1662887 [Heliocybe sulcata]|uniref:Uncharacterized protein n=1 Tax=Heliocybe sulcata TaxID=5364 RepID=A0A5C3MWX8_9AGAM|nr:hypothetical protein OE88DRAFT_1662887 [Heliocybe sulcata]
MPPLIPDLSSESDESDGFCSPPPLQSSFSSSSSSSCTSTPHTLFIEIPGLPPNLSPTCLGANTSNALSFLPHPPSPPKHEHNSEESDRTPRRRDKDKIRRDRHRERSRDRDVRERLSQLEIGWDGQGVGHEDGVVEDDERDGARKYRPFSTRICGLAENDEGCLAGF